MTIDFKQQIRNRLPEIAAVAQRFPLAVLAALALTFYFLLGLHKGPTWPDEIRFVRIPSALAAAFLWSFAATLYGEARDLEDRARYALVAAGWLMIALLVALADRIELSLPLLISALTLALSLAAYTARPAPNSAFWQFNHNLWFDSLASAVAMLLSAGGISVLLESLRYLFGLAVPYEVYEKVWVIAGFLVAPVYWLSHVPRQFDASVAEGWPTELVSRLIAVLVKYILVPLLLAYAMILHVYAVKILFDGSLPKGRLGWMVLTFGSVLAATALVAYPTRVAGGRLVAFFWRVWPWALVVPVGLLFLAVGTRVREYGLTEQRYLVALAGVWLASLVVTQGLARERDLRLIPGVLAGLLALAAFGPWGATGWPIRNQVREFGARLEAAGMLKDGRVPEDGRPPTTLLASDKQRLNGIIDFLSRQGRLGDLKSLFRGLPKDPFEGQAPDTTKRDDLALSGKIRERLNLGRTMPANNRNFVGFQASTAAPFQIDAAARLVGPFNASPNYSKPQSVALAEGALTVALVANILTVRDANGRVATFDLNKLSAEMGPLSVKTAPETAAKRVPLRLARSTGELPAEMLLTGASGHQGESAIADVQNVSFWLLLGP